MLSHYIAATFLLQLNPIQVDFSDLKQALLNRGEFWEDAVELAALHMREVQKAFLENL